MEHPSKIENEELRQYAMQLSKWQNQPSHATIKNILIRIRTNVKNDQSQEDITKLLAILTDFHKQANKAKKQEVSEDWFPQINKAKSHLRQLLNKRKDKKFQQKCYKKRFDETLVPPHLLENKHPHYQLVFELLYRHFILYFSQPVVLEEKKIVRFLDKVIEHLFNQFHFGKQTLNKVPQNTKVMMERLDKISYYFSDCSLLVNKQEMLEGTINAKDVAKCQPMAFFADEARRLKANRQRKQAKSSSTLSN